MNQRESNSGNESPRSELVAHPTKNFSFEESGEGEASSLSKVWLQISAFLELKTKNTQRTYLGILSEWCSYLGVQVGTPAAALALARASDLHAASYRKWLTSKQGQAPRLKKSESTSTALQKERLSHSRDGLQHSLANATIGKKLAALRRIYRLLETTVPEFKNNPFATDKLPTPSPHSGRKRPTEMIDFQKVEEILALPDLNTPKGVRDRAILAVLFGAGLRRSELINIRLGDFRQTHSGTHYLHLRATKSHRDADQALPKWAATRVIKLLEQRLESGALPGDYLFVSYRGKGGLIPTPHQLSDNGLYRLFKRYCKQAGVPNTVSPHSARATAITKLLDSGLSHREVREFSRHASVAMVEVYDKRRLSVDESPAVGLEFSTFAKEEVGDG